MQERKFFLFHLSLIPVREPTLETPRISRADWLRRILENGFEFPHRADKTLHWVPREGFNDLIFGVIEQKKPYSHHLPPSEGGRETISEQWQGAYVLLDPNHHDAGQRIAVEIDQVGTPKALLKSLLNHLNSLPDRPFTIKSDLIFDGRDFWKFSNDHSDILKYVTFKFAVPNMWGAENSLEEDLKATGTQTGADKVTVRMEAKDGIYTRNEKIENGVSYAERGAGEVTAKSLDGKRFSSVNKPQTTRMPKQEIGFEETRRMFEEFQLRILGRDKD